MTTGNLSPRMENAMRLADKCWEKVNNKHPEFVERYLELAEKLLMSKPEVLGDEFREFCTRNLLFRPAGLHHNTWVSGVRALKSIGWIVHQGYTTPTKAHNHMPRVSVWRSMIFGSAPGAPITQSTSPVGGNSGELTNDCTKTEMEQS